MKNLLWAIFMLLTGIFLIFLAIFQFAEVHDLLANGREDDLSVLRLTSTTRSRKGVPTYRYDAALAGTTVRLSTSKELRPGYRYPVLFSPTKLQQYSAKNDGFFSAWKIGRRSETAWAIYRRDFGSDFYLWLYPGLIVLMFVGAGICWTDYKKGEDDMPEVPRA